MREQLKVFENYVENNPQNAKHAIFATETSHQDKPETPETKFFKNLSMFFLRLKVPPARKS